jgi:hypothetical protein
MKAGILVSKTASCDWHDHGLPCFAFSFFRDRPYHPQAVIHAVSLATGIYPYRPETTGRITFYDQFGDFVCFVDDHPLGNRFLVVIDESMVTTLALIKSLADKDAT